MKKLLNYSIKHKLKHIPSALSQYSYLKYILPLIHLNNFKIVIGKPFGAQAYYVIWEELELIPEDHNLSYGVKHDELEFIEYSEETLGNALGVAAGISLVNNQITYCNISDGACQMGATLEAIQYIGAKQLPIFLTVDANNYQLTGSTIDNMNISSSVLANMFDNYHWNVIVVPIYIYEMSLGYSEEDAQRLIDDFFEYKKPTVIIYETLKGQGVREMEDDPVKWHYKELKNIDEITII